MSKVLVDNWTLERAAVSINDTYERTSDPNQEYASLVDALILFDDVTYFDTSYSYQWKEILDRFQHEKYLSPITEPEFSFNEICNNENMRYEIVQLGAIEYAAKATKLGIPFIVSEERNNFLEQYRKNQKIFVAKQTMDLLDQKLLNFYHEAIGTEVTPEFPALFDFVRSQTKNEKEFLNVAMQVKNSNEAKRFREYLEELDNEFKAGNIKKYKKLKDKYKNVIETSLNGFWRESESVTATISLGPFFSITCPVKTLDITIAPNLKLIRKVVKSNITNRKLSFNY